MLIPWQPPAGNELYVLSLRDPRCLRPDLAGIDHATLAAARRQLSLPVPDTLVVSGPRREWLRRRSFEWIDQLPDRITVSGRVSVPGSNDRKLDVSFTNISRDAAEESTVELVRLAERAGSLDDRLSLCFQRALPAEATALVAVNHGISRIRVRACRGLYEEGAEPVYFDEALLRGADRRVLNERVTRKPTALVADEVGTRVVPVPGAEQHESVLSYYTVRYLAGHGARLSAGLGTAVEATFWLYRGRWFMPMCRTLGPTRSPRRRTGED
ncbi:hypothetical protein [Amycolatopsis aidingensis]|uniref:hypothetical protein n=1 Tax=Amycolatopsis aidingensis TaxID=2842453 RepID=UPI001C0AF00F|nr:hypothetical protein [Amycolatopsis aidingensis]